LKRCPTARCNKRGDAGQRAEQRKDLQDVAAIVDAGKTCGIGITSDGIKIASKSGVVVTKAPNRATSNKNQDRIGTPWKNSLT